MLTSSMCQVTVWLLLSQVYFYFPTGVACHEAHDVALKMGVKNVQHQHSPLRKPARTHRWYATGRMSSPRIHRRRRAPNFQSYPCLSVYIKSIRCVVILSVLRAPKCRTIFPSLPRGPRSTCTRYLLPCQALSLHCLTKLSFIPVSIFLY